MYPTIDEFRESHYCLGPLSDLSSFVRVFKEEEEEEEDDFYLLIAYVCRCDRLGLERTGETRQ